MVECYTEEALVRYVNIKQELEDYKTQHFDVSRQCWVKLHDSEEAFKPCDNKETEKHQATVRKLKQQMETIAQDSLIDRYGTEDKVIPELKELFSKIAPLVYRRRDPENTIKIVGFNFLKDGELFTFSDPVPIKTVVVTCGCGHVVGDINKMTEHEALLAEEHLKVCQYPIETPKEELSVVSKHAVGRWGCKACYVEPVDKKVVGVASNFSVSTFRLSQEWCPKFLRPFRAYSPFQYLGETKSKNGCYGGILHKQISIALEDDGNQYLVVESMCDTCGYGHSEKQQIQVPSEQSHS